MKKKILITGGAGCLGSNLVEHWLPQGHEILVVDNFATSSKQVFSLEIEGLTVVEGDIANYELLAQLFEEFRPTHVVHSAASYKDPNDWAQDVATNVLGSVNIVKCCETHEVQKLINFQTALCYGEPKQIPIPVNHARSPFTSYGISKTAGESFILQSTTPSLSFRLANICGPRLSIGPIPTFYQRLQQGKDCFCTVAVRDFLDMSDFLTLMDIALTKEVPRGVYNVSTGHGNSVKDIFQAVESYLQLKPTNIPVTPIGGGDIHTVVLDPSETEKIFQWSAKVPFRTIIKKQLDWYSQYGVNHIYSHLANSKTSEANNAK